MADVRFVCIVQGCGDDAVKGPYCGPHGKHILTPAPAPAAALVKPQPPPKISDETLPAVWDLVIQDMKARDAEGRQKYGTPLRPFNGRDALVDAYQEVLDQAVYLRQAIFERDQREGRCANCGCSAENQQTLQRQQAEEAERLRQARQAKLAVGEVICPACSKAVKIEGEWTVAHDCDGWAHKRRRVRDAQQYRSAQPEPLKVRAAPQPKAAPKGKKDRAVR